jgi:hypothetical protein
VPGFSGARKVDGANHGDWLKTIRAGRSSASIALRRALQLRFSWKTFRICNRCGGEYFTAVQHGRGFGYRVFAGRRCLRARCAVKR